MTELNYQIVRSPKRKKLTITVERDRAVIVHAPEVTSDEAIRRVVDAKRQWILAKLRHPQKYQNRLHPPGKEVVSGESAPYLGRDYRIEIAETASGEIELSQLFLVPPEHQAKRRQVLRDWYIARAKEEILARAEQRARALGVKYTARLKSTIVILSGVEGSLANPPRSRKTLRFRIGLLRRRLSALGMPMLCVLLFLFCLISLALNRVAYYLSINCVNLNFMNARLSNDVE